MSTTLEPPPVVGPPEPAAGQHVQPPRRSLRRLGGEAAGGNPAWARPALVALLVMTAALYLWDLSASGWANSYYAAAVQAGSQSWKAWFFGALDSGNSITVDKPPASLWVMGLSARIFGFTSWSLLAPQALEGVAAVALLYGTVKRWSGPAAGLLAGAVLALTPAAALMFRFDNPDALLTLLLVAGAYCLTRAIDATGVTRDTAVRWALLTGVAIGFAFLSKMLQGFLVVPGFALVYLLAAPTTLGRRIRHLLAAGAAMVVSAGWYVAVVELWPASARPYIGGSTNNSLLDLVIGYNGLGRLTGSEGGGGGGTTSGTAGSSFGGATGLARLFSSEMGIQISWLLPTALVALVAVLWTTRRAPRTDRTRAAVLLWGSWLIVTGVVFSYMQGVVHPYYTVVLAPAVAAMVAIGGRALWTLRDGQHREAVVARVGLAAMTAAAGGWGFVLLSRNATWYPALRYAILVVTVVSALGMLVPARRLGRAAAATLLVGALAAGIAGPAAYSVATAWQAHNGSIPTAGPSGASGTSGGMGGMGAPGGSGVPGGSGGVPAGSGGTPPQAAGLGGGGDATSSELTALLKASTSRWAAATTGAQSAASLELASGASVMGIGGFTGTDASVTPAQFKAYVASGQIHYYVVSGQGGGQGGPGGSSGTASEITSWVTSTFTATTVGSATVYDLTSTLTSTQTSS